MNQDFFHHNRYMAEIANCIISDKVPLIEGASIQFSSNAQYQYGVREIIGLYLLIPYINSEGNQLKYDGIHKQMSIYTDEDIAFKDNHGNDVKVKDLRDTLCHSFVSCDLQDGSNPVIVFDDRAVLPREQHNRLANTQNGAKCILVDNEVVLTFLKKSFKMILDLSPEEKSES